MSSRFIAFFFTPPPFPLPLPLPPSYIVEINRKDLELLHCSLTKFITYYTGGGGGDSAGMVHAILREYVSDVAAVTGGLSHASRRTSIIGLHLRFGETLLNSTEDLSVVRPRYIHTARTLSGAGRFGFRPIGFRQNVSNKLF